MGAMLRASGAALSASGGSVLSLARPSSSAQMRLLPQRAVSRRIWDAVVRPLSPRRFASCSMMRMTSQMPLSPLPTVITASAASPPRTTNSGMSSRSSGERQI